MKGLLTPYPVRIADVYDDGEDARHFTFEPLDSHGIVQASPGQFFMLTLPGAGEAPFTYTGIPDNNGRFDALVRRVGKLTRELLNTRPGQIVGCRGPYGHGWPVESLTGRTLVVSGGCGLAPLASVIDALSVSGSPLAVIYGARTPASQVLSRERGRWQGKVTLLETFDIPAPGKARTGTPLVALDEALEALGGDPDAVLTCGPEVMMDHVAAEMVRRGIPPEKIWLSLERRMHCGVGLCGHCYVASTYACRQGPTYRWDELSHLRKSAPSWQPHLREVRHC